MVVRLDMDGYHLHTRDERCKLKMWPDQLEANDFARLSEDIRHLRTGNSVSAPVYDHKSGRFISSREITCRPVVLVEGLHAALINSLSNSKLIDISCYLDTAEDLRRSRKVHRDVADRSYSFLEAVKQIKDREYFVKSIIFKQRHLSDIVIQTLRATKGSPNYKMLISSRFMNNTQNGHFLKSIIQQYGQTSEVKQGGNAYLEIANMDFISLLRFIEDQHFLRLRVDIKEIFSGKSIHGSYSNLVKHILAVIISLLTYQTEG